jgi:hypothetical protein
MEVGSLEQGHSFSSNFVVVIIYDFKGTHVIRRRW